MSQYTICTIHYLQNNNPVVKFLQRQPHGKLTEVNYHQMLLNLPSCGFDPTIHRLDLSQISTPQNTWIYTPIDTWKKIFQNNHAVITLVNKFARSNPGIITK